MTITNISRSKSYEMITDFGLKIWDKLGVEGTLGENEDPKECYKQLGQLIEETHKENAAEMDQYRGMVVRQVHDTPSTEMDSEFETLKKVLSGIDFKEDAVQEVNSNYPGWKLAVEVKKLINSKPSKK